MHGGVLVRISLIDDSCVGSCLRSASRYRGMSCPIQPRFAALRSPVGEQLVFDRGVFVEEVLPQAILRRLDPAELNEYRRPFREPPPNGG